jgi:hypothetical protein
MRLNRSAGIWVELGNRRHSASSLKNLETMIGQSRPSVIRGDAPIHGESAAGRREPVLLAAELSITVRSSSRQAWKRAAPTRPLARPGRGGPPVLRRDLAGAPLTVGSSPAEPAIRTGGGPRFRARRAVAPGRLPPAAPATRTLPE